VDSFGHLCSQENQLEMKKLNLLSLLLFATVVIISSCSSDPAPKEQFKANGETINLSTAKLYLKAEVSYSNAHGNFVKRDYIYTDGTFVEGNGWSLDHYTNATYIIAFQPSIPADDEFVAGAFPASYYFNDVESGNAMYFFSETTADATAYYEVHDGEPSGTFTISGAMNDGETMTLKFNGTLSHWHYVEEVFTETLFTGSLFAKAEVIDIRPI
jgi:hypothetical protein